MSVVLTVAPTGPIAFKSDNQHLPTSPEEIGGARGVPGRGERGAPAPA